MTDLVYILGAQPEYEELRYSLRSLRFLPHDRVWIAGAKPPDWVTGVGWIAVEQEPGYIQQFANQRRNLMVAASHPKVSYEFVLMNDDYVFLEPLDGLPPCPIEGRIADTHTNLDPRAGPYQALREWLLAQGETTFHYAGHVPMMMDKRVVNFARRIGHIEAFPIPTLYGNLARAPYVRGSDHVIGPGWEDRWSVSLVGEVPGEIRTLLSEPSPYEH